MTAVAVKCGRSTYAEMLRILRTSVFLHHRSTRGRCSVTQEDPDLIGALYELSVDISKVRKLKGWVLRQSPAYVKETAALLSGLGASGPLIARVLELHPEAILCQPQRMEAQKQLWMSVCVRPGDLLGIIEKFPASFFTSSGHLDNQKANIQYLQSLHLNKRIICKLMATAPQGFSRPVQRNQEMVQTLQTSYLQLGGRVENVKVWLQKLLSQNPFVLLKLPEDVHNNLRFLRDTGFTSSELLHLMSKLRGFVTELSPESMRTTLGFSQEMLGCSGADLRQMILRSPALLSYSVPVLAERFRGLMATGVGLEQIRQTPTVLELTPQIVEFRVGKLRSHGYEVRKGSLEVLNGTKKDFEISFGKLQLRPERPMFNPVAPLRTEE